MNNIAIFASGSGSNAENIIQYFHNIQNSCVKLLLSNKKDAFVLERARKYDIKTIVFDRHMFYDTNEVIDILLQNSINLIVLAGFLWLVPVSLIKSFQNRIINIHPALLPKYGGKGMYGTKVHEAVIANRETKSGITIHVIDEEYDKGKIIFQSTCDVRPGDTPEELANRVHKLEYKFFPQVIEQYITENFKD